MTRPTTTRPRTKWLILAALALSTSSLFALVDTRPVAVRAQEWAERQRGTVWSARNFSRQPIEYRRAAFRVMSPIERSAVSRAYLEDYIQRETLSPDQRAFLRRLRDRLTPATYSDTTAPALRAAIGQACEQIAALFPDAGARALLTSLGTVPDHGDGTLRALIRSAKNFAGLGPTYAVTEGEQAQCDCKKFTFCTGCSGFGGRCNQGSCDVQSWGCGCLFAEECDGKCDLSPGGS
jgi:hypothetical protein